jgi:hypothetical protein
MPFDISFGGFINFFLGMMTGVVAFLAFITFFSFRGNRLNLDDIRRPDVDFDEEDLRKLIMSRQTKLKRNLKVKNISSFRATMDVAYELVEEISRYFFPDSKYPMLELSVHELIDLNHYISTRIDELLDIPILKNAKKMRVISIVKLYERKRSIEESKVAKAAKKYKLGKVLKYGSMALNAVNPVYWFRKLVLNTSLDAMTRKICVVVIGVVGEETTKVYSKKLFDTDVDLGLVDGNMQDLLTEGEDSDEEIGETEELNEDVVNK